MSEAKKCNQCGEVLADNSPAGHCVACLLRLGLAALVCNPPPSSGDPAVSIPVQIDGEMPRVANYQILRKIGEGGCGAVYLAEQLQPLRRQVALKVIKMGMDTRQVIARFETERQTLALMDHPSIAKVFDAGATENGRPYFAMELVRGLRITDYCDQHKLDTRQRLLLFIQVCQAIQHAHQKGIIHRDIKPSNILITDQDGAPAPKIIDFGIAKATSGQPLADQTFFTSVQQFVGTPAYMSPEQAGLGGQDIDTRSDVYSLGVLLYEILTGQPPFEPEELRRSALAEVLRILCEKDPPRPSARLTILSHQQLLDTARQRNIEPGKLSTLLSGDLDWIVMRALEKDRSRRYETANGLARDLQRHLADQPVEARSPSRWYRLQKFAQRNRLVLAATAGVIAALICGLSAAMVALSKEKTARTQAEINEAKAETEAEKRRQVARFLTDMIGGVNQSVAKGRDTTLLREILDKTAARVGKDLTNQPAVEEELRSIIGGIYYYTLRDYENADLMYRRTLQLRTGRVGETNLQVAELSRTLALVLLNKKEYPEAEQLARRALEICRMAGEQEAIAESLNTLGVVLRDQRKFPEAEILLDEAYRLQGKLHGYDDQRTIESLRDKARLAQLQGRTNEARSLYSEVAAKGDPWAQTMVGGFFFNEKNYSAAANWWRKAAEQHIVKAEVNLGWLYQKGLGVARDPTQALKWALMASQQDAGQAQNNIGVLYAEGDGVEQNYEEAAKWYRKAASLNNPMALNNLGQLYRKGKGVPKNTAEALRLCRKAAEAGDLVAQVNLAEMCLAGEGGTKEDAEAVRWYGKAAEKGNIQAQFRLAEMYARGNGVNVNLAESEKLYHAVWNHADAESYNDLAWTLASDPMDDNRNGSYAVRFAEKAVELVQRTNAAYLDTLAVAYAETRQFEKAIATEQDAMALLKNETEKEPYASRLNLFRGNLPFRDLR